MALALAWCLLSGVLAVLAQVLLEEGYLKETSTSMLLFPLLLISRAVSGLVDMIGPANLVEPASQSLSRAQTLSLAILSLVLYWAVVVFVISASKSLWRLWRFEEKRRSLKN